MEIEEKAENPNSEENPNANEEHEEITIEKQKNPL